MRYYYIFLGYLESLWNWWVLKIHPFPEIAITIVLVSMFVLIVMHIKRNVKVTVIEGDEIHNLIRAIRRER